MWKIHLFKTKWYDSDVEAVEKVIRRGTSWAAGVSRDIERLVEIAKRHNLALLEDNAHSLGVKKNGKQCGTFGLAAALSFCQNKLITTVLCCINNRKPLPTEKSSTPPPFLGRTS